MAIKPTPDPCDGPASDADAALADLFDWHALARPRLDPDKILDAFLEAFPQWARDPCIVEELRRCIAELLPIDRAATEATWQWLGLSEFASTGDSALAEDMEAAAEGQPELLREFAGYELLERVGRGGMGVVYKARQPRLGRIVCLKMLPPGLIEPRRVRRLADEARLAGALQHPGIVTVFEAGECDGQPYYVMEFVHGETLAENLAQAKPSALEAASLAAKIAEAVQHAHQRGVLHRDLKPANVLLDKEGRPRITDFGLARRMDVAASGSGIAGTPAYMAPEQARGAEVDARTDVYGLGAILYEMLSGRPPHVGDSTWQTLRLVESAEPAPLRQLRPGLSRDLETICLKCLQKQPSARYASVAALGQDLERFLRGEPIRARPVGPTGRTLRWARRRPATAVAVGVSVVAVILVAVFSTIAFVQTRSALDISKTSEAAQRRLASRLRRERQRAEDALYQSRIARVAQLLDASDVVAARSILGEIERHGAQHDDVPLELDWLDRRAWPEVGVLATSGAAVIDAEWLPGGQALAAILASGELGTWDPSGRRRRSVRHTHPLTALAAGKSQLATADARGQIQWWHADSLALDGSMPMDGQRLEQLVWIGGDWLLALDSSGTLRMVSTRQRAWSELALGMDRVSRIAVSRDATWLAAITGDGGIALIEVAAIRRAVMAPPTTAATSDVESGMVGAGTISSKQKLETSSWFVDVRWSPASDRLAAVDASGLVVVWDVASPSVAESPMTQRWRLSATDGPVAAMAWSENILLLGEEAGGVTALDTESRRPAWHHPSLPVARIAAGEAAGRWALIDEVNSQAALWDAANLTAGQSVVPEGIPVRSVALDRSGRWLASRDVDGAIVVRDLDNAREQFRAQEPAMGGTALCWNPARDELAIGREHQTVVYDIDGRQVGRWAHPDGTIWSIAFSPDGRYLASAASGSVALIEPASGTQVVLKGHEGDVRAVAFAPDGRLLATVDAGPVLRVWRTERGELLSEIPLRCTSVHAISFVNDRLLFAADGAGRIWRVAMDAAMSEGNRWEARSWAAHQGPIWSLVAVGDRVISGGQDGRLVIWNHQGELVVVVARHTSPVWSITCHGETHRLLASTTAGGIHFWH